MLKMEATLQGGVVDRLRGVAPGWPEVLYPPTEVWDLEVMLLVREAAEDEDGGGPRSPRDSEEEEHESADGEKETECGEATFEAEEEM